MKFPSMICFILLARSDNVAADNGTTPDAAANTGTANAVAVADGVGADGLVSNNILAFCHGDYFIGFLQRESGLFLRPGATRDSVQRNGTAWEVSILHFGSRTMALVCSVRGRLCKDHEL